LTETKVVNGDVRHATSQLRTQDMDKMDARSSEPMQQPNQVVKEYLSLKELCELIPFAESTIRNKMSKHELRPGVHYFKPGGGRPVFRWSIIKRWLEGEVL
jgi:hypothetical protein